MLADVARTSPEKRKKVVENTQKNAVKIADVITSAEQDESDTYQRTCVPERSLTNLYLFVVLVDIRNERKTKIFDD
uniref:Uncharacterized protein n=1 Tax=Romanomermis culicivorax TaxID=13658 RepID=A0A915KU65_ROMCU